jgi:hypothetical protein
MKHIETYQKYIEKSIPAYGFSKSQENKQWRPLQSFCDFQKDNNTEG